MSVQRGGIEVFVEKRPTFPEEERLTSSLHMARATFTTVVTHLIVLRLNVPTPRALFA